jgi:hypothetical protein
MTTKVLPCDCHHKFQDQQYGPRQRVDNFARKAFAESGGWRCTICTQIKRRQSEAGKQPGLARAIEKGDRIENV